LGFLKIVAGIAGVSLDTLVQRDAQRRLRRVMAVTGGVFAGLLAMIGMTLFAIQSRKEAQLQRAEAEGLVEFMLTDLRAGLKGVGRLDVMTHVNERAMDYYEGQSNLADMPAASLERRARILHAMGEDDEKRGDLEKALAKFGEAHRVTRALLEMDPDNADRIFGHAQSEYWVGYLAYLKEDWGKAELHWIEYQSLAELLIGLDAGQSKWRRESGYSNGNICTLSLHRTDQSDVDVTSCAAALSDMQLVQNMLPNNKRAILDVANRYGWYGDALNRIGDKASSMKQYNFQHELLTELRKQKPDDFEIADELIRAKMSMTKGLHSLERIGDAADLKRESAALARHLIERDPDNRRWKILLSQIEKAEY
jgi:tetratricopeptide (TPR) repeat protein